MPRATTNTPAKFTIDITPERVRAVFITETKLKDVPLNVEFHDLGATNQNLKQLQGRLAKEFNKTVSTIYFRDTIYTLTDRLNAKNNY